MARYEFLPEESSAFLDASSSIHPIRTTTNGLTGFLDLDEATGELHVPLGELRSGNPLIDRETRRRLDTNRYPEITAVASSLEQEAGTTYRAAGKVTAMGETVDAEGELTLTPEGDDTLRIKGEQTFDVRQWGVQPPSLLVIKVHPDVIVRLDVVARRS